MKIILFDGTCNLCNQIVQFIIKRDPNGYFHFCSINSEKGKQLLSFYNLPTTIESIVFIEGHTCYIKSDAALQIGKYLNSPWRYSNYFRFIPKKIRDYLYDYIARNRHKWFGQKNNCMLPSPEIKKRFIDD